MLHGRCLSPKPLKDARAGWFGGWFRHPGASGVPSHGVGTLAAGRVRHYEGICRISKDEGQWLQARCWNGHFHPTRMVALWLKYLPFKEDVKLQFPSGWRGFGCTNRNHLGLQGFGLGCHSPSRGSCPSSLGWAETTLVGKCFVSPPPGVQGDDWLVKLGLWGPHMLWGSPGVVNRLFWRLSLVVFLEATSGAWQGCAWGI